MLPLWVEGAILGEAGVVEHGPKYQAWVKSLGRQGRAWLALESRLRERLPAMCHSHSGVSRCEQRLHRLLPLLLWAGGLSVSSMVARQASTSSRISCNAGLLLDQPGVGLK